MPIEPTVQPAAATRLKPLAVKVAPEVMARYDADRDSYLSYREAPIAPGAFQRLAGALAADERISLDELKLGMSELADGELQALSEAATRKQQVLAENRAKGSGMRFCGIALVALGFLGASGSGMGAFVVILLGLSLTLVGSARGGRARTRVEHAVRALEAKATEVLAKL